MAAHSIWQNTSTVIHVEITNSVKIALFYVFISNQFLCLKRLQNNQRFIESTFEGTAILKC